MPDERKPGLFRRVASHQAGRIMAIPGEVAETLTDKVIPQGASEVAQALNSRADGYVPYGAAQRPLEVEGPAVSYRGSLRESSRRAGPEQGRGNEVER
jgi:hypothetical protein